MAQITTFGKADSLSAGEIMIPLVIIKRDYDDKSSFAGFIPGFVMKNIVENSKEECLAKLKNYLSQRLKAMMKNGEEFPFFPTKDEIMKDFENVYSVDFIKITSNLRKN